mmetsp:Transcript_3124/g.9094  ORF Transcript_3124/g.9094 Transcript_3124/m.9094 type:complete len:114 (+) Transcript_3124:1349-1690(+)
MQQPFAAKSFNTFTTVHAAKESNPERGSSRKIMVGFEISSTATAVRFFSPPESPLTRALPTCVSAHFCKRSASSNTSVCALASSFPALLRSTAAISRISRGVLIAGIASSCMT